MEDNYNPEFQGNTIAHALDELLVGNAVTRREWARLFAAQGKPTPFLMFVGAGEMTLTVGGDEEPDGKTRVLRRHVPAEQPFPVAAYLGLYMPEAGMTPYTLMNADLLAYDWETVKAEEFTRQGAMQASISAGTFGVNKPADDELSGLVDTSETSGIAPILVTLGDSGNG